MVLFVVHMIYGKHIWCAGCINTVDTDMCDSAIQNVLFKVNSETPLKINVPSFSSVVVMPVKSPNRILLDWWYFHLEHYLSFYCCARTISLVSFSNANSRITICKTMLTVHRWLGEVLHLSFT